MSRIFPSNRTKTLLAPTRLKAFAEAYEPVDCDFTDDLEFASVSQLRLEITHQDVNEATVMTEGKIIDIVTESNKEEYLVLDQGARIRLDRIRKLQILD